jgi:hypothetical protein
LKKQLLFGCIWCLGNKNIQGGAAMDTLVELFCLVDDFCNEVEPHLQAYGLPTTASNRGRCKQLSMSEIMTLLIYFHQSQYRHFKAYYTQQVETHLKHFFPALVSYQRFVELMPSSLIFLCLFIHCQHKSDTGIYFVDSTTLAVCHHKRASSNRVFRGIAKKSKSTMGWFFGFKLHILINDRGELMAFKITQGNVDDRKSVGFLSQGLVGKMVGDKGYISQKLFEELYQRGLQLITKIRKNMTNQLMQLTDKLLLRKRAVVESVIDQLKNISQIEHSRHRSPINFLVNLLGGLAAYCLQPKKPSLSFKNRVVLSTM